MVQIEGKKIKTTQNKGLRRAQLLSHSHPQFVYSPTLSQRYPLSRLNDMATTTGLISSTFLSGETSSFPNTSFSSSSSSLRFHHANFPANLRMVRIPTLATASKPATTTPRQPRGIMKPRKVSPEMQALVGTPEISRTQALKLIWAYIKQNNLQVCSVLLCLF